MKISSGQFADVAVAAPVGRIDHQSAGQLDAALAPLLDASLLGQGSVVLDFAGVDYISSVGLRVLMVASQRSRAHAARIAVAALQPVVAEIFAISRFDRLLEVYPTVRGALEQMSASALEAFDAAQRLAAA